MSPIPRFRPHRDRWRFLAAGLLALALTGCSSDPTPTSDPGGTTTVPPDSAPTPDPATTSAAPAPPSGRPAGLDVVADGLRVPWGVAFLPDERAVLTERDSGRVLVQPTGAGARARPVEVGRVSARTGGEGGLLGVAVSPDFGTDRTLFLYVSTERDNRVVRARLDGDRLGDPTPVLTGIPTASNHDGGRLAFGPDGHLYVSTGDALDADLAQDRESLAGKILRITPDGDPAPDNPWNSPVYSMGHRNVQGLAFDDDGNLWASEFGEQTWDELNLVRRGGNYGWPVMEGNDVHDPSSGADRSAFLPPAVVWNPGRNSPSGLAWYRGRLWLGALRGERLWSVPVVDGDTGQPEAWYVGEVGRIRTVVATPRGELWITTSNRDGRGTPAPGDDRVLSVDFD